MADAILHVAADVVQLHARLDLALDVRTRLAVHFRRLSVALDLIFVAGVADARFLARREWTLGSTAYSVIRLRVSVST